MNFAVMCLSAKYSLLTFGGGASNNNANSAIHKSSLRDNFDLCKFFPAKDSGYDMVHIIIFIIHACKYHSKHSSHVPHE